jgi:hypothetical protein
MGDNHHEIQWEIFRIQQMEVLLLYHFSGHMNCGDISPYIGLKQMVGTSVLNRFLASMAIDPLRGFSGREGGDQQLGILEQSEKSAYPTGLATGLLLCASAAKRSDLAFGSYKYLIWRWWGLKLSKIWDVFKF